MPVRLAVHDATGSRLAVLADGLRQPGDHEVTWRAEDVAGRPLPSGPGAPFRPDRHKPRLDIVCLIHYLLTNDK
jgi:hypothetical protein